MSNSVVFLLIAVGLSVLGTCAVWLHGRPRRSQSSVELFNRSLQALGGTDKPPREPLSGVTIRRPDGTVVSRARDTAPAPVEPISEAADADATVSRASRPSPRPAPRPAPRVNRRPAESREASPSHEGIRSGS